MIKKLMRPLEGQAGSTLIFVLPLILVLMMFLGLLLEYQRLFSVAGQVKQSVSAAAVSVAIANYDDTYSGTREGYSGGYQLSGLEWSERIDIEDIKKHVADDLYLVYEDDMLVKKELDGDYHFKISNLEVEVQNPSFKGSDELEFTIISSVNLTIPHNFGFSFMPPLTIKLTDTANWTNKY